MHISLKSTTFAPDFKTPDIMRKLIDTFLRLGIKLCLLTGVAFTFAACYGPAPSERYWQNEPDFQKDQQKMEQQLRSVANDTSDNNESL